ncbi:hypothetical protein P2318_23300 [Myxococcaceae bacterium GXIMD 01537]
MDGCVYCDEDDEKLLFSEEIDACLHLACLKQVIEERPEDPEVRCLSREFASLLE